MINLFLSEVKTLIEQRLKKTADTPDCGSRSILLLSMNRLKDMNGVKGLKCVKGLYEPPQQRLHGWHSMINILSANYNSTYLASISLRIKRDAEFSFKGVKDLKWFEGSLY